MSHFALIPKTSSAFKLNGNPLAVGVAFSHNDIQYPANWLRLSTADEKTALGITEVDDPKIYDSRFYWGDGTAKALDDKTETIDGEEITTLGVKSVLKAQEKVTAGTLLAPYDWYVVRKAETSKAIPTAIKTYRTAIRTACATRETEIDNCADTAALVTLYSNKEDGTPNMTQYPEDPNA